MIDPKTSPSFERPQRSPGSGKEFSEHLATLHEANIDPLSRAVQVDPIIVNASNQQLGYDPARHQDLIDALERTPRRP